MFKLNKCKKRHPNNELKIQSSMETIPHIVERVNVIGSLSEQEIIRVWIFFILSLFSSLLLNIVLL